MYLTNQSNADNTMVTRDAVFDKFLMDGGEQWLCQKPCSPPFNNGIFSGGYSTAPSKTCID